MSDADEPRMATTEPNIFALVFHLGVTSAMFWILVGVVIKLMVLLVWPLVWAVGMVLLWLLPWALKGAAAHVAGFVLVHRPVKSLTPTTEKLEAVLMLLMLTTACLAVRVFAVQPSIMHEFFLTGMLTRVIAEKQERECRELLESCEGDVERLTSISRAASGCAGAPACWVALPPSDQPSPSGSEGGSTAREGEAGDAHCGVGDAAPSPEPILIEVTCVSEALLDVPGA
eukprot:TRINITY_DN65145_c0_g1_i1.p2 TRINITY_DN65145_c0_g1~~TRINITY_DN65145_c0_g1_i1.p2  ORF type:complete len:229 (+),score=49.39 TRINITY_DN65145_c0_g1_i1:109-795(+)